MFYSVVLLCLAAPAPPHRDRPVQVTPGEYDVVWGAWRGSLTLRKDGGLTFRSAVGYYRTDGGWSWDPNTRTLRCYEHRPEVNYTPVFYYDVRLGSDLRGTSTRLTDFVVREPITLRRKR